MPLAPKPAAAGRKAVCLADQVPMLNPVVTVTTCTAPPDATFAPQGASWMPFGDNALSMSLPHLVQPPQPQPPLPTLLGNQPSPLQGSSDYNSCQYNGHCGGDRRNAVYCGLTPIKEEATPETSKAKGRCQRDLAMQPSKSMPAAKAAQAAIIEDPAGHADIQVKNTFINIVLPGAWPCPGASRRTQSCPARGACDDE
jgi:hypothetical protein